MTELNKVLPENEIIDKAKALELFGTENQKVNYAKTNKLKADTKKSLERTLEQYYESFEEVKHPTVPRAKAYKLGALRNEVAERNHQQGKAVKQKTDLRESIEFIILKKILHREFNPKSKTHVNWTKHLGLISSDEWKLYSIRSNREDAKFYKKDVIEMLNEEEFFDLETTLENEDNQLVKNFYYYVQSLAGTVHKAFMNMEKFGLIDYNKRYKAVVSNAMIIDRNGKRIQFEVDMSAKDYQKYLDVQDRLLKKHDLKLLDVMNYPNLWKVREFKAELKMIFRSTISVKDFDSIRFFDKGLSSEILDYTFDLDFIYVSYEVVKKNYNAKQYFKYAEKHLKKKYEKFEHEFEIFYNDNLEDYMSQRKTKFEDFMDSRQRRNENDRAYITKNMNMLLWIEQEVFKPKMAELMDIFNKRLKEELSKEFEVVITKAERINCELKNPKTDFSKVEVDFEFRLKK